MDLKTVGNAAGGMSTHFGTETWTTTANGNKPKGKMDKRESGEPPRAAAVTAPLWGSGESSSFPNPFFVSLRYFWDVSVCVCVWIMILMCCCLPLESSHGKTSPRVGWWQRESNFPFDWTQPGVSFKGYSQDCGEKQSGQDNETLTQKKKCFYVRGGSYLWVCEHGQFAGWVAFGIFCFGIIYRTPTKGHRPAKLGADSSDHPQWLIEGPVCRETPRPTPLWQMERWWSKVIKGAADHW